jgi:hypothetical protein
MTKTRRTRRRTTMTTSEACPHRPGLPEIPVRIARLPVDERGYPVPWFVEWIDGKPDFRVSSAEKIIRAVKESRCWICGDILGVHKSFLIGPMCAINRVSAEPPAHTACATFSAKACPFLSRPHAKRREHGLPEDGQWSETGLKRNPGVTLVWTTGKFWPIRGAGKEILFRMGDPVGVAWYAEGRDATRAEVEASVESGYPSLLELAEKEGPVAVAALAHFRRTAELLYP